MAHPEQNTLIVFIGLLIIGSLTSYFAGRKGRNPVIWFILGLFFGIFALLALYLLPPYNNGLPTMSVSEPDPSLQPTPIKPLERSVDENKLWYYLDVDHKQMGPVSTIALRDLWDHGMLNSDSYLWTEGMAQWEKIENLPAIKKVINK